MSPQTRHVHHLPVQHAPEHPESVATPAGEPLSVEQLFASLQVDTDCLGCLGLAVEECEEHVEQLAPTLWAQVETLPARVREPDSYPTDDRHLFATFLLAHRREPRLHALLLELLRAPEGALDAWFGDLLVNEFGLLLSWTSGGERRGILELVRDPAAPALHRRAGLDALLYGMAEGQQAREPLVTLLLTLLAEACAQPTPDRAHVTEVVAALCDLHPLQAKAPIQAAFDAGLVDPRRIKPRDVRDALELQVPEALTELEEERAHALSESSWARLVHYCGPEDPVEVEPAPRSQAGTRSSRQRQAAKDEKRAARRSRKKGRQTKKK